MSHDATRVTTIEEELAYVFGTLGCIADDAQRVYDAIQAGLIDGHIYTGDGVGCFYGHLSGLDAEEVYSLAGRVACATADLGSPIERLIIFVERGDLPTHASQAGRILAQLAQALLPYLPSVSEISVVEDVTSLHAMDFHMEVLS